MEWLLAEPSDCKPSGRGYLVRDGSIRALANRMCATNKLSARGTVPAIVLRSTFQSVPSQMLLTSGVAIGVRRPPPQTILPRFRRSRSTIQLSACCRTTCRRCVGWRTAMATSSGIIEGGTNTAAPHLIRWKGGAGNRYTTRKFCQRYWNVGRLLSPGGNPSR